MFIAVYVYTSILYDDACYTPKAGGFFYNLQRGWMPVGSRVNEHKSIRLCL